MREKIEPRLTSIESVMSSSHLILCCPLLLLPPIPPSIRVFSSVRTLWTVACQAPPSMGILQEGKDWGQEEKGTTEDEMAG